MDKGGQGEWFRVVIDASVAAKWVISGEPWEEKARALREKMVLGEVEVHAPQLLLYEVASVVLKSVLKGILELRDGIEALKALGRLGLKVQVISWDDMVEVLNIATLTKLTAYDSAYLYLSKKLNAPLITADDQLKKKGGSVAEVVLLKDLNLV
ncbi:MAG: hypothetical protein DRJ31_02620 [Candidatus Methanomethylicota archaeon]|uniref:PIN domain-containing protein n=1 Tax=Thermoproteota archaeon TaxID=2056631 RepID=A0A497ERQ0_9CREN|nr:MAG: hypothetical protein DRJ31_02620 [Candidatus Verstraetearchaeota archaeon]